MVHEVEFCHVLIWILIHEELHGPLVERVDWDLRSGNHLLAQVRHHWVTLGVCLFHIEEHPVTFLGGFGLLSALLI